MEKVAVMLPIGYRGGSLRAAKNIAKSIAHVAQQQQEDVQVVFSYVSTGDYNLRSDFRDFEGYNITLRETVWKVFDLDTLTASFPFLTTHPKKLIYSQYCLPTDGANDFYDCDFWLIISDRLPAPLFPLRRYACFIYDYIQRYVPEIWGDDLLWQNQNVIQFSLVNNAECNFVTTPTTQADMIAYAGVSPAKVNLLNMDFDPLDISNSVPVNLELPSQYFAWSTNTTHHKNHINAFNAIKIYYEEMGGTLDVVITGPFTEYFDINKSFESDDPIAGTPHIEKCRKIIQNSELIKKRLHVLGNLSDAGYITAVKQAAFFWHPTLYDNGTFSVIEAAYLGCPSLSARYPAMEYVDNKFHLNLSWFDPRDPVGMAQALFTLQNNHKAIQLPEQQKLLENSWQSNAPLLYRAIKDII